MSKTVLFYAIIISLVFIFILTKVIIWGFSKKNKFNPTKIKKQKILWRIIVIVGLIIIISVIGFYVNWAVECGDGGGMLC